MSGSGEGAKTDSSMNQQMDPHGDLEESAALLRENFKGSSQIAILPAWPADRAPGTRQAPPEVPRGTPLHRPGRCNKEFFQHAPERCQSRCSGQGRCLCRLAWWYRKDRIPDVAP